MELVDQIWLGKGAGGGVMFSRVSDVELRRAIDGEQLDGHWDVEVGSGADALRVTNVCNESCDWAAE